MAKGIVLDTIEAEKRLEKSPFIEGLLHSAKGALLGAPTGALIAGFSGGSAKSGAFIGSLLAAAAFGVGKAMAQDLHNKEQEAELRIYLEHIKDREPFYYMPPKPLFDQAVRRVR